MSELFSCLLREIAEPFASLHYINQIVRRPRDWPRLIEGVVGLSQPGRRPGKSIELRAAREQLSGARNPKRHGLSHWTARHADHRGQRIAFEAPTKCSFPWRVGQCTPV